MPSNSFINRLGEFLAPYPDWEGLDIGCGEFVGVLAKYGVDAAPIKKFTNPSYPFERFKRATAEKLPYPDNHFDYVVSSHLLEHIEDVDIVIKEMTRVSKYMVIANVPRYTRDKKVQKSMPCVSLDFYYFSAFPEKLEEFGLTKNDFSVWSPGATTFLGYEAPHRQWFPTEVSMRAPFDKTGLFKHINIEECPGNCGEFNVFAWLK